MSLNLDDPRVKKTRRAMREAFIRLIIDKGYDSVSIQDIANEAEAARITFYRHYRDKEDLLNDCLNVLYEELVTKTEQEISAGAPHSSSPIRVFYGHLQEQEQLYRVLFSSLGTHSMMERMKQFLAKRVLAEFDAIQTSHPPEIPKEIIAYHLISAQLGLGIWWLEQDKPYPVEYMAQVAMLLSFTGILRPLGIEDMNDPLLKERGIWEH